MLWDEVEGARRDALLQVSQAFEQTSIPLTLCDTRLEDCPVTIANGAFLELTGYGFDDVLGKNCRFLQGDLTNDFARKEIRASLAQSKPCQVILKNRHRDGTVFNNLLFLHPLRDRLNSKRFVMGCQFALSDPGYMSDLGYQTDDVAQAVAPVVSKSKYTWVAHRRALIGSARNVAEAWLSMR